MKQLKVKEKEIFNSLIYEYVSTPIVQSMNRYMQHGTTTTYEHVIKVTETCFKINRRWRLNADEEVLTSAALLHDFYLYDWHEDSDEHRLHGFLHAHRAAVNARENFCLKDKAYQAIETHMWPLTFRKIPRSKEAWILCFSDKWCALLETFRRRKNNKMSDFRIYENDTYKEESGKCGSADIL